MAQILSLQKMPSGHRDDRPVPLNKRMGVKRVKSWHVHDIIAAYAPPTMVGIDGDSCPMLMDGNFITKHTEDLGFLATTDR